MAGLVAVVGSRELPTFRAPAVADVVRSLLQRDCKIGTGGALGADLFALQAVVASGASACAGSIVFLPGDISQAPARCRPVLHAFVAQGGEVVPGQAVRGCSRHQYLSALFARTIALVKRAEGVVAFIAGESPGTWFTCREAARLGKPVVVFPVDGARGLRSIGCGLWRPVRHWAGAWRWFHSVALGEKCRHGISVQCCAGLPEPVREQEERVVA
ncbi:DNA-processing protein DprA [Desulforhabdus sp. TSK]|uniref:DNA-processing protein DprA n=1 Tax=Desulforhabdus sp. TSK TaxID=2925014 RepID=UPI001FC8DB15|nr:DNA-processing protein DprA [Desulforhabdus sp. TSK]GKT09800.1 hypothetical protein DSTSK_31050 [Desulforhabdus sp. TSK]